MRVGVNLSYRIVTGLLRFDCLIRDLDIDRWHTLELRLLIDVLVHILTPRPILLILRKEHFIRFSLMKFLLGG